MQQHLTDERVHYLNLVAASFSTVRVLQARIWYLSTGFGVIPKCTLSIPDVHVDCVHFYGFYEVGLPDLGYSLDA